MERPSEERYTKESRERLDTEEGCLWDNREGRRLCHKMTYPGGNISR